MLDLEVKMDDPEAAGGGSASRIASTESCEEVVGGRKVL